MCYDEPWLESPFDNNALTIEHIIANCEVQAYPFYYPSRTLLILAMKTHNPSSFLIPYPESLWAKLTQMKKLLQSILLANQMARYHP